MTIGRADGVVQVCSHVARCYSVAAQFEGCRTKIQEISAIVKDISYVLYYRVRKNSVVTACIDSVACVSVGDERMNIGHRLIS